MRRFLLKDSVVPSDEVPVFRWVVESRPPYRMSSDLSCDVFLWALMRPTSNGCPWPRKTPFPAIGLQSERPRRPQFGVTFGAIGPPRVRAYQCVNDSLTRAQGCFSDGPEKRRSPVPQA